ncbi:MAG: hypothetical protein CMI54_04780 [Parcubacteria group bacterium]|nr:hypothetical protein [Parcubacteria group bacterium]|tara:strand:+ start:33778 stop:34032 length:255 start_codon:yes stop_codon:yes gene_type:complete
MIKINECKKVLGVTRYRISKQIVLDKEDGESEKEYDKRRKDLVYKRGDRGWWMMYKDKVLSMKSPVNGGMHDYECDLDEYIKTF